MTINKTIKTHPTLFTVLFGLLLFGAIMVIAVWFPWLLQAWDKHKRLIEAVWFTAALFVVCLARLWRWRRRGALAFWASMSVLFLLHVVGILIYVRPLLIWQWIPLILFEAFAIIFLVDFATRRFGHRGRHNQQGLNANQHSRTNDIL